YAEAATGRLEDYRAHHSRARKAAQLVIILLRATTGAEEAEMINVNDSVNPRVIRLNSYRHLCELGFIWCLILIVCGAVVLKDEQRLLWVIVLSVGALLSLVFAYLLSSRAIVEDVW